MSYTNIEKRLIDYLDGGLVAPVGASVPNPRPGEFVRVWRTGGAVSRVVDRPQMTVEAWGSSRSIAFELGSQCRDLLLDAAQRATAGFHRVQVESLYYDPDPESGHERFTLAVFLTVRANRA